MFKTFLQWLTNSKEEENEGIRVHLDFIDNINALCDAIRNEDTHNRTANELVEATIKLYLEGIETVFDGEYVEVKANTKKLAEELLDLIALKYSEPFEQYSDTEFDTFSRSFKEFIKEFKISHHWSDGFLGKNPVYGSFIAPYYFRMPNTYRFKEGVPNNVKQVVVKENLKYILTRDKEKELNLLSKSLVKYIKLRKTGSPMYDETVKELKEEVERLSDITRKMNKGYTDVLKAKAIAYNPTIITLISSVEWGVSNDSVEVLSKALNIVKGMSKELDYKYNEMVNYEEKYKEDIKSESEERILNILEAEERLLNMTKEMRNVDNALKSASVTLEDIRTEKEGGN